MSGPVVVSMDRVNFTYAGVDVLHDISFEFYEGDFVGAIGPNAGGKTTLLKLMLGLLRPDSGSIRILGVSPDEARDASCF